MKEIMNKLEKYKLYILTFITSLVVISIIFILNKVAPFGKKSLLCIDFFHQYGPMLGEYYDRFYSGKNLFYSFNLGLGIPFFRNFLNYMSSPFNFIILLFSRSNLLMSYSFVIGLKAVASSCTLVYFLSHKFKTKDLRLIPLGILYAFSAYYSAYYWNLMWLDGMVFLPLITLGIEYIINNRKWKFYTVWLAIMLVANYFIGYMICIFSILYFLVYSIYKLKKDSIKNNFKYFCKSCFIFAGASILAGAIVSIFLIPLFYSIKSISATGGIYFPTSRYYSFTIEDFLKYHFTGVTTTVLSSDSLNAPNISAGILSVTLLFVFLLNNKISFKTKICYTLLLSFFILAFFWAPLDYILQAFHVPNDLPYRYSFLYTFILIIMAAYALLNINNTSFKLVTIIYSVILIILLLMFNSSWVGINSAMITINIVLISIYFITYLINKFKPKFNKFIIPMLIITASVDSIIAVNQNWDITHDMNSFYDYDSSTKKILEYIDNQENSLFYRVDTPNRLTFNDPAWYNYYGMTTFSSMAYESMAHLQHKLGLPGNEINSYYYVQTTPVYDLMFNIDYFIGPSNDESLYSVDYVDDNIITKFNYNIGLGYSVNNNLKFWEYESSNPFFIQNDYIYKATNVSDVFEEIQPVIVQKIDNEYDEQLIKYSFLTTDDNIYFYTDSYEINYFIIDDILYYNNDSYYYDDTLYFYEAIPYTEKSIINISPQNKLTDIYISYHSYTYIPTDYNLYHMYKLNNTNFYNAYNKLKYKKLNITEFKENEIKATINMSKNSFVYTSIPYDDGWHVYVDGKEVKTFKLGDALLAFDASEGNHKIIFKYIPKGFILGTILTLMGTSFLIICIIRDKQKKKQ